tara:strand:- start:361 stop:669 length:309 start_codon:yes stop_codon:yes gene_type:complete
MLKKIASVILLTFFVTSCGNTFSSVKRGITGEKEFSTEEFLVQKKDPLVMPPDYENLPTPDERVTARKEISSFEEALGTSIEDGTNTSDSVEETILKQIQSK